MKRFTILKKVTTNQLAKIYVDYSENSKGYFDVLNGLIKDLTNGEISVEDVTSKKSFEGYRLHNSENFRVTLTDDIYQEHGTFKIYEKVTSFFAKELHQEE